MHVNLCVMYNKMYKWDQDVVIGGKSVCVWLVQAETWLKERYLF